MIGTNLLCKTGDWKPVITVCVYIHMFSIHTFCIWRNRLFHLGLVPKSSGIKYMMDANNRHPNIYSISIFGGWIFSGTTYSTVIVGSRKNAKAHPFPHDWHQLALQWPKKIYPISPHFRIYNSQEIASLQAWLLDPERRSSTTWRAWRLRNRGTKSTDWLVNIQLRCYLFVELFPQALAGSIQIR